LQGDLLDQGSLSAAVSESEPDEVYNLAAQSFVQTSWNQPVLTGEFTGLGVTRMLEAIRLVNKDIKFYQASSSEMFGKVREVPQNEKTPFNPRSPYGIAKMYAFWIAKNYREAYNLFISNGILFNHEGERRGETFVTKKVTKGLTNWYKTGVPIKMGNLDAKRDWGYAKDYVYGMYLMLQQEKPDDFVLATGEFHSIREFIEEAAKYIEIDILWLYSGSKEVGIDKKSGKVVVEIDSKYFRPTEVDILLGDSTKAKEILGWEPKVKFKELVKIMMEYDLK